MGCSSSTQTQPQGGNRPPAKSLETNGPKKSASSDISDQIADDIETIPDQTKLEPLTENEASINEELPVEDEVEAIDTVELEAPESLEPTEEENGTTGEPEDKVEDAEQPTEVQPNEEDAMADGEIEDSEEVKTLEEIPSEEAETKEEETGHLLDEAEPEISMLIAE
ncbi:glutamate-rich protein 5 isoform X2 [Xenopus laevis]|uniref:Glutamate-rich protein 5 isoform X2 n=1 Tax=Xenopus laevis TaxID=8355 RepID=A0A8J0T879_XENLA|nr:glutamate-rich protein 5 isoform X2 [Xenopus laevis]